MTQLGLRLRDIPETIGWDGLVIFLKNQSLSSAYIRDIYPEYFTFSSELNRARMIVDLIDSITMLRYEYALSMSGSGPKPKEPKRYPTPWNTEPTEEDPFNAVYGKGEAISSVDFYDWYYGDDG